MDVTDQITLIRQTYGGSDNTNPSCLSASKNLNYAKGASILNAPQETITVIPFTLNYQDTVGLFGAENSYVKINVDIIDTGKEKWAEPGWEASIIDENYVGTDPHYTDALTNDALDTAPVNDFDSSYLSRDLVIPWDAMVSVNLLNNKTGNKYIDSWFDVRLYTKQKEEHPFDEMYLHRKDYFYIGFHARNQRRLPYNVSCTIGTEFKSSLEITDRSLIAREN